MTKNEAMQMALTILLEYYEKENELWDRSEDAIDALLAALAQPEPEPFEYWNAVEGWVKIDETRQHFDSVGCGTIYKSAGENRVPLYTAPPQRKPLTDEEVTAILKRFGIGERAALARAIEAAHGIGEVK